MGSRNIAREVHTVHKLGCAANWDDRRFGARMFGMWKVVEGSMWIFRNEFCILDASFENGEVLFEIEISFVRFVLI